MITFPQWLPALIAMGVSVFVVWVSLKIRAELAERDNIILKEFQAQALTMATIKSDVLDTVRRELRDYVSDHRFRDYVESHGREVSTRDKEIGEFMTRHRDWKHDTEPKLRGIEMSIDDLKNDIDELKEKSKA